MEALRTVSKNVLLEGIIAERVGKSDHTMAIFLGQGERCPSSRFHVSPRGNVGGRLSMSFAKLVSSHMPHWKVPVSAVSLTLWDLEKLLHKVAVFSQHMVKDWARLHDPTSLLCPFLQLS